MSVLAEDKLNGDISIQAGSSLFDLNRLAESSNNFGHDPDDETQLIDLYDEDEAEQKYLKSKPTCFLVVGKPGAGKTTIAKKIADEWKAELISSTDLIQTNIQKRTELGKKAQELLLKGEALTGVLVAQMIEDKINSPEVGHHGYVLDGFPSQSESNLDIQKQMDMLNNWKIQPDFIINMRIPDNDLIKRRIGQKVDPISGMVYVKDVYEPEKIVAPKKDDDDDDDEDEEENEEEGGEEEEEAATKDEFFTEPPLEVIERLVIRPEDSEVNVIESINSFKDAILRVLENRMANMDNSYLIELDANISPTVLIKQLIERLNMFPIRKATKSNRLNDAVEVPTDEDGVPQTQVLDPVDTEELFQSVTVQARISPKFKWRRSKWLKYCPVSLRNGAIVDGRPEYAATFLDKVYAMSSEMNLQIFLKNPREFLRSPLPRSPCKFSIIGAQFTGKTTLATLLARKYNAKIIDMNVLIQPKLKSAKEELVERIKSETVIATVELVKVRVKEQMENERMRREIAEQQEKEAAEREEREAELREAAAKEAEAEKEGETAEGEKEDEKESSEKVPTPEVADEAAKQQQAEKPVTPEVVEKPKSAQKKVVEEDPKDLISDKFVTINDDGELLVDPNHPDVISAVEKAAVDAAKQNVTLPATDYVAALDEEIKNIQSERLKSDPTASSQGGWILDNFPQTAEQLNAMVEGGIVPDTFLILHDATERSYVLTKRWYLNNRAEVDARIQERIKQDQARRAEEKLRKDMEKQNAGEGGDSEAPKAEATDGEAKEGSEETDEERQAKEPKRAETLEKIIEEDESKDQASLKLNAAAAPGTAGTDPNAKEKQEIISIVTGVEPGTPDDGYFPMKGPEVEEYLKKLGATHERIKSIQAAISGSVVNEPVILEINKGANFGVEMSYKVTFKTHEEVFNEASTMIENMFKYRPMDYDGIEEEGEEEEEEEEGEEEAEEEEEEEEEDEDNFDPTLKEKNITFGDTNHYCPVTLFAKQILQPGSPEYQCKYREKIYRFSSEDNKNLFMEHPENYLPSKKPPVVPPTRIVVAGARGAGKSIQARELAEKLDLFHFKFRDRLQEIIIGKTKKPVGPEFEEEKDEEEEAEAEAAKANLPELSENEEAIKSYLEKDDALTNDILDIVIAPLWTEEPFKSRGFVLDGFPNNESEASYLVEKGLLPDAVVIMSVSDDNIVKRLLPPRLERWRLRQITKKKKKEEAKEKKKKEIAQRMTKRRMELMRDRDERRQIREANGEDIEEEEEDDIEATVQEEFADELQEDENEEEQQEDEARENMTTEIRAAYESQSTALDAMKDTIQEVFVPRFTVDGNRKINIVKFVISKRLEKFIDYRESLFERVYPVKYNLARKLIDGGFKYLGSFARWCPVRLLEGHKMPPLYDDTTKPFPVMYRNFIYFLSSKEAREKFMKHPIKYLRQKPPQPVTPLKFSIVGPPKSGKTTLANRFCKEYGCLRLSIGEAIRMVLEKQSKTELATKIEEHLVKGKTVPDELSIQCLEIAILDVKCQTRGYILDGFPVTKQQVKFMNNRGLIPVHIIELKCDVKEMLQRGSRDRLTNEAANMILHDSPEILAYKYKEWKTEVGPVRSWYTNEHRNWTQLDGQQSKWMIWEESKRLAERSIHQIQTYLTRINHGKAASIANLCVTYEEMTNRLGDFGQYCPVSLALNAELVDCAPNKTMDFVAEYQGHYYKMFSKKELDEFISTPFKYVPPYAPRKLPPPELLPKKRTASEVKEMIAKPIELLGYCPVTYYDGKQRYEAIERGNPEYAVEYKNKVYTMLNEEAQERFMRKPELYSALKLPHKLPPVKESMNVLNLPMLGYLEQTASEVLIKALHGVGTFKPKFPFLSSTRSALLHVAYYLKAYNPKASEYRRKKYKQKLAYFEENCQLIHFLATKTTVKYKDPSKFSNEFNAKYESFFALQQNIPTMNWLA